MAEGKKISFSIRMAKANDADMDAAYELSGVLDSLGRGYYPAREGDEDAPIWFDSGDRDHLQYLHERLTAIEAKGSLFRVVGGLSTLLNPANAIVDPNDDCIALHPRLRRALETAHYVIRANGEWGTFYVREGVDDQGHHWCELTCNTAFGCVGYHWGSMGRPAREFLAKVDKGYLLGKLWGVKTRVFDAAVAIEDAKRALLKERRALDIGKDEAREVYDELNTGCSTEFEWHLLIDGCEWLYGRMVDSADFGMVPNPQAEGFWRELWPAFLTELQSADGGKAGAA